MVRYSVIAGLLLVARVAAAPSDDYSLSSPKRRLAFVEPCPLHISKHVISLQRSNATVGFGTSSTFMREYIRAAGSQSGVVSMLSVDYGSVFLAPVTIGNQTFDLVADSGSSDTWVVLDNYTCYDPSSDLETPRENCDFASYYYPSSTIQYISNRNFNISYADGETLNGIMAYEDMAIADIAISHQEIALVQEAAWYGDGMSSGLIGLAYATLTNAYYGDNPRADIAGYKDQYNPPLTTMFLENLTSPMFSLALQRPSGTSGNSPGGYLAIGGIPDVPHDPTFASTPILSVGVDTATNQPVYEFYTIQVGGWAVSESPYVQFNPFPTDNPFKRPLRENGTYAIVDSGTSLVYAPDAVVAAAAASYSPPAAYSSEYGMYVCSCQAKAPLFGVAVGDKIFYVNAADMIHRLRQNLCIMGVQSNNGGYSILGDVFLRNVMAVFDVGAAEMRFAARQFT